jgi:DNA-binding IclR family transcriptional regulator
LQEVVYLAVLDAGEVVYVSRNGPNRAMSSGFVLGARVPGHVTSAGMLMLANLPSAQLEEWFATHSLPAYTQYTISNQEDLRKNSSASGSKDGLCLSSNLICRSGHRGATERLAG